LNKICKNTKNFCQYLESGNIAKSSKFQSQAFLSDVLKGIIIDFKLYRKNIFCGKFDVIFEEGNMNFGRKLGLSIFP